MIMCSELGSHTKYFFEVSGQDEDYFYVIPGSCVRVEDSRLTPSTRPTRFVSKYVRELTTSELNLYENCFAI